MTTNRKLQIGVMGSMADLQYNTAIKTLAEEVGCEIAKQGATLVFGAEKDSDSLSTAACRGAKRAGGLTVGVTYGKGLGIYANNYADVVIATGLERGGGREFPLVLSCDVVICLAGGSGTLTEIAIAYQADIPIVVLQNTGGWSEKLANQFLDDRQRVYIQLATTPTEAVAKAISAIRRTLFVGAMHGNESIGVQILKQLEQDDVIKKEDWIIGNPLAFEKNQRYVESDLNRSFPGNKNGKPYEERRAAKILECAQKYKYVIDIHGTDDNTGIFIIISNPTQANIALAKCFDIPNIVLWPSTNNRLNGPLNQSVDCGIEIECGPQKNKELPQQLQTILTNYLSRVQPTQPKRYFQVYGKLESITTDQKLKSFELVNVSGESFFPLLVDRYPGVKCYKMKQIDPPR